MTDLVSADEIEAIVGTKRHDTEHYARASSSQQTVYILHSRQCRESTPDLRDCNHSIALDRGIRHRIAWSRWRLAQDRPVPVKVFRGYLVPDLPEEPTNGD